jgi:hypothetical protein
MALQLTMTDSFALLLSLSNSQCSSTILHMLPTAALEGISNNWPVIFGIAAKGSESSRKG